MKEKARIFVFDDDADSLASVAAALRRDGYEVRPHGDPKEGLARLAAEGGDVVVTDLRMPGLSGMEVLRQVVKGEDGRNRTDRHASTAIDALDRINV